MEIEKSVAAIVINKAGQCLLLHPAAGKMEWVLPGGHAKHGEKDIDTLRRELFEECGIRAFDLVKGFAEENSYVNSRGNRRTVVVYIARVDRPDVRLSDEHTRFVWVGLEDAIAMFRHERWKEILRKAIRRP